MYERLVKADDMYIIAALVVQVLGNRDAKLLCCVRVFIYRKPYMG
jgi:hypothetical protein